jgi:hypothetical protein
MGRVSNTTIRRVGNPPRVDRGKLEKSRVQCSQKTIETIENMPACDNRVPKITPG